MITTSHSARSVELMGEEGLVRARSLLLSYASAAERGLAALDSHDLDALEAILAARQELIPQLDPLLSEIDSCWRGGPAAADAVEGLRTLVRATQQLDTKLTVALSAELQRIGQELEQLEGEEAVRSAYGQTSPAEGRRIDLFR